HLAEVERATARVGRVRRYRAGDDASGGCGRAAVRQGDGIGDDVARSRTGGDRADGAGTESVVERDRGVHTPVARRDDRDAGDAVATGESARWRRADFDRRRGAAAAD